MPSQVLLIATTTDDGWENSGGTWATADTVMYTSDTTNYNAIGLSFLLDRRIPFRSLINSAYIRLNSSAVGGDFSGSPVISIQVESANPFTVLPLSTARRPSLLTAIQSHDAPATAYTTNVFYFGAGDVAETNIGASIQSLLNSYGGPADGLKPGVRINVFLEIAGAGGLFAGFDDSDAGANDPQLTITWTEPLARFDKQVRRARYPL